MTEKNAEIARAYYTAVSEKAGFEKFLHNNVELKSPVQVQKGKEAVVATVTQFTGYFDKLTIREAFGSRDHAMVVYNVEFSSGACPAAAFLTVKDGLIINIELFFDTKPFN